LREDKEERDFLARTLRKVREEKEGDFLEVLGQTRRKVVEEEE
jgi:hypothetical protein